MCDKAIDICPFVFDSVADQYTSHKMCDKVVSKESFMLKYCLNRYNTQKTCHKVVRFVPDWFVTNKMLQKLCYIL